MKRILAAILALSLLFAFCGCEGKEEKDNNKKDKGSSSQKENSDGTKEVLDGIISENSYYAKTYDKLLENANKFYNGDMDVYLSFGPKEYMDYAIEEEGINVDDFLAGLKERFDNQKAAKEATLGANLKYSIEVTEKEKVSADVLKSMGEAIKKEIEIINPELFTEGYKVKLKYTTKGDNDQESFADE